MKKYWKPFKWPGLRSATSPLFLLFFLYSLSSFSTYPKFKDIPNILERGSLWTYIEDQPLFQGITMAEIQKLLRRTFSERELEALHNPNGNQLNTLVFLREIMQKDTENARKSFRNGIIFRDSTFMTLLHLAFREGIWGVRKNVRVSTLLSQLKTVSMDECLLTNFNLYFKNPTSKTLNLRSDENLPSPKKRKMVHFREPIAETN